MQIHDPSNQIFMGGLVRMKEAPLLETLLVNLYYEQHLVYWITLDHARRVHFYKYKDPFKPLVSTISLPKCTDWSRVDCYIHLHPIQGEIILRVDGQLWLEQENLDTAAAGTLFTSVEFFPYGESKDHALLSWYRPYTWVRTKQWLS